MEGIDYPENEVIIKVRRTKLNSMPQYHQQYSNAFEHIQLQIPFFVIQQTMRLIYALRLREIIPIFCQIGKR